MRGELPSVAARVCARPSPASPAEIAWSRFVATITNRDLTAVVAVCTIGYLIAVNVILRFPDFGEAVATLATFP